MIQYTSLETISRDEKFVVMSIDSLTYLAYYYMYIPGLLLHVHVHVHTWPTILVEEAQSVACRQQFTSTSPLTRLGQRIWAKNTLRLCPAAAAHRVLGRQQAHLF